MPNNLTLLDVAKNHGSAAEIALIESVMTHSPELSAFPSTVLQGTSFTTVDRHKLPNTGFTWANEGIAPSKSLFKTRQVACHIFRGAVNADKAVVDAFNMERKSPGKYQALEADGVARSAMIELGKQIYYGTDEDAKGFPGLRQLWAAHFPLSGIGINATGTSANAATSVYAVKFGEQYAQVVWGGNKVLSLPPFRTESAKDANGGQYDAYVSNLTSWVGLQCVHPAAIGRIYNLTTEVGKGLTDVLIAQLLALFPVGFTPDALFMTRQSRLQLQLARTVVLQGNGNAGTMGSTGGLVAPLPTEAGGIPIVVTDNILNTEAIVV